MSNQVQIVLVTAPNMDEAARLGRTLVEDQLAACVNLMPGVRSIYRWQNAIHDDAEVLLIIKTTAAQWTRLTQRVLQLHPYATPEVLALPVAHGSEGYLAWLYAQVQSEETS